MVFDCFSSKLPLLQTLIDNTRSHILHSETPCLKMVHYTVFDTCSSPQLLVIFYEKVKGWVVLFTTSGEFTSDKYING